MHSRLRSAALSSRLLSLMVLLAALALPPSSGHLSVAAADPVPQGISDFARLPVSFEPNAGQTDPSVRFLAHTPGGVVHFTPTEIVLAVSNRQVPPATAVERPTDSLLPLHPTSGVARIGFVGANPAPTLREGPSLPGRVNYIQGNDPTQWRTNLPTYQSVQYTALYPGVNLRYDGPGGALKGTYTVAAGADAARIRWRYAGAEGMQVDPEGNLQVSVPAQSLAGTSGAGHGVTVTEEAPVAWQDVDGQRRPVGARYEVGLDGSIGFALGDYDPTRPLTIDPVLTYSTYLGGTSLAVLSVTVGNDSGRAVAVDATGSAYVTGSTNSVDFPTTAGALQVQNAGSGDVFVAKLNPAGTALDYSTYLGGKYDESGFDIAVDTFGSAYVTGRTSSRNFPTPNGVQPQFGGGTYDAFVTKLNAAGSALVYSTYLGGSGTENVSGGAMAGIAVDSSGSAYVTGATPSSDFPTTAGSYQPQKAGAPGTHDAYVTKLSSAGSEFAYSTYLGGSETTGASDDGEDFAADVGVDGAGNAYVTGYTRATDFPTVNAFQPANAGGAAVNDAFVAKLDAIGSGLVFSTYLGGSTGGNGDFGTGIAVDRVGAAYVTGYTMSTNFPTTAGSYQPSFAQGPTDGTYDAYVAKFDPAGPLVYSTYFGSGGNGSYQNIGDELGMGVAVDGAGNAYVAGHVRSNNLPTKNPVQAEKGGGTYDAFLTSLDATGSALVYSTYLGGTGEDLAFGVATDSTGGAYVTGVTNSTNFPTTSGAVKPLNIGGNDAFVVHITNESSSADLLQDTAISFTTRSAVSGQYSDDAVIEARLTDSDGRPIEGADVLFELSAPLGSRGFTSSTDAEGLAAAAILVTESPGLYRLSARYGGEPDVYSSSETTTDFVVEQEDSAISLSVDGVGAKLELAIHLYDHDTPSNGIAGRTVNLFADGVFFGSTTTRPDGTASLSPPPRYQDPRVTFKAVFEGDELYRPSSATDG